MSNKYFKKEPNIFCFQSLNFDDLLVFSDLYLCKSNFLGLGLLVFVLWELVIAISHIL